MNDGQRYHVQGKDYTISEMAEKYNLSYDLIKARIKYGWPMEQVVELEERPSARRGKIYHVGDFKGTITDLSNEYDLPTHTIVNRLKYGWSIEEAVGLKKRKKKKYGKIYQVGRFNGTLAEVAEHFDVNLNTLKGRLRKGQTILEALNMNEKDVENTMNEDKLAFLVNHLVQEAVDHGGDAGGAYYSNDQGLEDALQSLMDNLNLTDYKIKNDHGKIEMVKDEQ